MVVGARIPKTRRIGPGRGAPVLLLLSLPSLLSCGRFGIDVLPVDTGDAGTAGAQAPSAPSAGGSVGDLTSGGASPGGTGNLAGAANAGGGSAGDPSSGGAALGGTGNPGGASPGGTGNLAGAANAGGGSAGDPGSGGAAPGGSGNSSGTAGAGMGGDAGGTGGESCSDGVLNQDETDVDCGGVCPACPTCTDGIQNQDETDVDCGGTWCPVCPGCTWQPFGTPEMVTIAGTQGNRYGPSLAADLKTIYFGTNDNGLEDMFWATRTDRGAVFGTAVALDELNTPAADGTPFLSHDGLTLYFASDRAGGSGSRDIMLATRPDTSSPFGAPTWLDSVNRPAFDQQPSLTPDELFMVFTSTRTGGAGDYDLWTAERADRGDAFSTPTNLAELNTSARELGASMSADGLSLYFTSNRSGGRGETDIWIATRNNASSPFRAPENLSVVNSSSDDSGVELSPDGRELFWASNRSGRREIWRACRDCL